MRTLRRRSAASLPEHAASSSSVGIARGVVAHADIPAVVMAVNQHEALRLDRARDLHDRDFLDEPAVLQPGPDRGASTSRGERHQLLAAGLADGGDRDLGLARQIIQIRRAPDRGAGAPVDVDAGIDRDQPDGAPLLGERRQRRIAEAFGEQDPAGELLAPRRRSRSKPRTARARSWHRSADWRGWRRR